MLRVNGKEEAVWRLVTRNFPAGTLEPLLPITTVIFDGLLAISGYFWRMDGTLVRYSHIDWVRHGIRIWKSHVLHGNLTDMIHLQSMVQRAGIREN